MIFEPSGLGTARFDACTSLGAPNAMVTLRTQWVDPADIEKYATTLLGEIAKLWEPGTPSIRMQIYGDQVSESCYMIILDQVDHTRFSDRALSIYRSVVSAHRTQCPQPPITHDVCFLPSGHTVQYQGRE